MGNGDGRGCQDPGPEPQQVLLARSPARQSHPYSGRSGELPQAARAAGQLGLEGGGENKINQIWILNYHWISVKDEPFV